VRFIEIRTTLTPFPASVGTARRFVRDVLTTRMVGYRVVDTVELLTSEVVTNALVHARSAPELTVEVLDDVVRVEVSDTSTGEPVLQQPDPESASGRGIAIVELLAAGWGVERMADDGKRVWFEVST
jgi:anti-sigma regulatory factor (Ser/Thr protein kinase)